ncbi:hypothetical protein FRC10_010372 [Ceratobasidium sp. 414]|nr:hypothetical protein FRC10_010372 [Ceratobasidium sp. 414]
MASESPTWRPPSNALFQPNIPRGKRPEEELLSAYEAEEERITNVLCRKLEQLREEKTALENTLEAESESHVNRLTRQISQLQAQLSASSSNRRMHTDPEPHQPTMLIEAMCLENAQLRTRVADLERDFLRVSRINDVYRQELLEHRRRLGLPYESLIGLAASASQSVSSSPADTFSPQPYHRRIPVAAPSVTRSGHATTSLHAGPSGSGGIGTGTGTSAVPIPRVQSQTRSSIEPHVCAMGGVRIHPDTLALTAPPSGDSTPPSSPSYSLSPTTAQLAHSSFFPGPSSHMTTLTTPASNPLPTPLAPTTPLSPPSTSTTNGLARALTELASVHAQRAGLSYPSVPPPSLASSLGSGSPVVPTLRVPPNSRRQSAVAETGSLRPFAPPPSYARRGGAGEDELEEIGEAYSDEDGVLEEEDEYDTGYRASGGLEIGRGRGRGRGGGRGDLGLGLTGTR